MSGKFVHSIRLVHVNFKLSRYLKLKNRCKEPKNDSNSSPSFWIVNENLFIAPLLPILKDIRLFATLSKEVVIVNFVDFPIGEIQFRTFEMILKSGLIHSFFFPHFVGFYHNPERHLLLLQILATELGDITYTKPWDGGLDSGNLTLDMMDRSGKNLIIQYNEKTTVDGEFCDNVNQQAL